jgi:UDP-glucose 4-epimerase
MVFGASGFIGRHLVTERVRCGDAVATFERSLGSGGSGLKPGVERFEGSVIDTSAVLNAVRQFRPDVIFHLASPRFQSVLADPVAGITAEITGTVNVLNAAADAGVSRFFLTSSAAVYRSGDSPLREGYDVGPIDAFGLAKLCSEEAARMFAATHGIRCVALRLFNVYGPGEHSDRFIPRVLDAIRLRADVVLGNIDTRRDYIYVDDAISMIGRCCEYEREGFWAVNIGTGVEHSGREIVAAVEGLIGIRLNVTIDPSRVRAVDRPSMRADLSCYTAAFGPARFATLRQGLHATLRAEGLL